MYEEKRKYSMFRFILFILLFVEIILVLYINFQTMDYREYERQLSLGDKYLEEIDYENAELCYRKAIKIDDKKAEPYLKIADVCIMQGDYEKASDILSEAQDSIPESSKMKRKLIEKRQEDLDPNTHQGEKNSEQIKDTKQDIDIYEVIETLTGYPYIGENEYLLSLIRDPEQSGNYRMPKTELIEEKGYICAKKHDFDNDGKEEILVVTMESNKEEYRQYFLLHMLEEESGFWKDFAVIEVPGYGSEPQVVSDILTDAGQCERVDFFVRDNQNDVADIFVEIYMKADYFSNGETWELANIQYKDGNFQLIGNPLTTAGSSISAELTLDINNSEYPEENSYAQDFINRFVATGLKAPAYLSFYTPLVYEDSSLIYLSGCRKTSTISTRQASEWQKGSEESLPGIRLTFRDYTKPENEDAGRAGALYTEYMRDNKPDAWYVIVDMDGMPALVVADSRGSGLSTRRMWCSYADNAEIFLINKGNPESLGYTTGYTDAAVYYAENKITVMSESGNISYRKKEQKLQQEVSEFGFDYVYALEFHQVR